MPAVTIHSDFGAQENKVFHCFHCFPTCLPWSDGTRCHVLSFLNVEVCFLFHLWVFSFDVSFFFFNLYIFYWRIIALQNFAVFSQTSTWISHEVKWSEVAQSCPTLCDPMDCSLPCSSIHEIFQARVLEWIAISFSRGPSWPRDRTRVSCIVGRRFTVWATREVRYTYIPSRLNLPPVSSPAHPSRLIQSPCLSFLSHAANSGWLSIDAAAAKSLQLCPTEFSVLLFPLFPPSSPHVNVEF